MDIDKKKLEDLQKEAQEHALKIFMLFLTTPKYLNSPNTMFMIVTSMAYDIFLGSVAPLLNKEQEEDIWDMFVQIALSTRELPFKKEESRRAAEMLKMMSAEDKKKVLPKESAIEAYDEITDILEGTNNVVTTLVALMISSGAFSTVLFDSEGEYEEELNGQFHRYRKFKNAMEAQSNDTRH